jgi:sodium/hydrogen antiporter
VLLVFALRVGAFIPALLPAHIPWRERGLIAWFGPRGLSSLLLVLLAVFGNVPGSRNLLTIARLVVLSSIVLHGFSPFLFLRSTKSGGRESVQSKRQDLNEFPASVPIASEPQVTCSLACPSDGPSSSEPQLSHSEYLDTAELVRLEQASAPVVVVDARTDRSYNDSQLEIPGAVRLHPDHASLDAERLKLPFDTVLAVLCA